VVEPGTHVAPASVLIVDDDPEMRHTLHLLFEFEEFDVVGEAENGVEAVGCALRLQPDFVILDYLMPRLDGEGTAELLRAVSPNSRIVAFSAALESRPRWADAFLNKSHIIDVAPLMQSLLEGQSMLEAQS
jgi:chemotaxis response regulator CheB